MPTSTVGMHYLLRQHRAEVQCPQRALVTDYADRRGTTYEDADVNTDTDITSTESTYS